MDKTSSRDFTLIIRESISGNRNSQKALFDALSVEMFSVCLEFCRNEEDAEDVLIQGFMKLFMALDRYSYNQVFTDWSKPFFIKAAREFYRRKSIGHKRNL